MEIHTFKRKYRTREESMEQHPCHCFAFILTLIKTLQLMGVRSLKKVRVLSSFMQSRLSWTLTFPNKKLNQKDLIGIFL